jgi:hypothetical protein
LRWDYLDRKQAGEMDTDNSFDEPERVAFDQSSCRVTSGQFDDRFAHPDQPVRSKFGLSRESARRRPLVPQSS